MPSTLRRATAVVAAATAAALGLPALPSSATSPGMRDFSRSFTDTCTVLGQQFAVPATASGRIPVQVPRGRAFRISDVRLSATIPAVLATQAYDLGARRAVLTLQVVNARGVGVLPAVRDVLARDVATAPLPVRRGQSLPFTTPAGTSIAATFTAGAQTGTAQLQAGSVRALLDLYDAAGRVLAQDVEVTCSRPVPAVTITSIRVV